MQVGWVLIHLTWTLLLKKEDMSLSVQKRITLLFISWKGTMNNFIYYVKKQIYLKLIIKYLKKGEMQET